ncbi:MAG: LacI family DNA-binding transcriptional regulator [Rhizobiales bacterium]|nr:LacI family DNA-binding transcriptional regulator [Hyphomicrobiales bacterium]
MITVAQVARVSPATVSRALNHPNLVSPKTRKRVEDAIRKTGYIRNRAAQAMHGRRSATIGLVVPTMNFSIFAELVQSFNDAVTELGFTLLLATHRYDLKTEYQLLRKFLEHRVDGLALIGLDHNVDTYKLIETQNVPAIAAWSYSDHSAISCVGSDNGEAGRVAARHILSLGHRRIGFVFPPTEGNDRARSRQAGVIETLRSAGVEVPEAWAVRSLYSIAQSKAACLDLLQKPHPPTALICGNDIIAQGAIYAAMECRMRVPNDLSIMGIGDFAGSSDMVPALSTIRIPAQKIGLQAGSHLIESIINHDQRPILRIKIDAELKSRSTTAPPRGDQASGFYS